MTNPDPTARTVLQPFSTFALRSLSSSPSSITSLSISQSFIYLGTHSGSIVLLSADLHTQNLSSIRTVSLTNSPIESLLLLPDIEKLLVHSDGSLFLADSALTQGNAKKLNFAKGATAIAKRITTHDCEFTLIPAEATAAASTSTASRRLFKKLGDGIRANGSKTSTKEGNSDNVKDDYDNVKDNNDNENVFVVVVGKKLVLIEIVRNGGVVVLKEMPCMESVKDVVWINDSIIIGTVNGYILFSCVTGEGGVLFTLPEACELPLLKVLVWKEKKVMLLVDNVGVLVNANGQPVGGSLVFRKRPESLGELCNYVVGVRDGKMELYHKKSGRCVQTIRFGGEGVGWCVVANEETGNGELVAVATATKVICYRRVPSEEQIKDLLRKKNFKEAISLVEELECDGEISPEMLSFVHAQVGFLLLFDLHFEEAVNHFLQSETMQPSEVFPFIMRDPNRWSLLVPRNRYWGLHPPPVPLEDVVDDGILAIQRAIFLRKAGVETPVDDDFLLNLPSRPDLLELAIINIIRYLEVSRRKELALPVREGVDTLLMYLYRALNRVDDMENLASSENNCIVEELENLLDESGHLRTVAFLCASKGMSSKALSIWRILARNYSSGLWKDPAVENDGQDEGSSIPSGKEIAANEASKILEELSDQDLVLQHLGWIADINPVLAVLVLTSEKRENQLTPDTVIASIDNKKVEVLQSYLQWLIEDQDSDDTHFHTLYALSLAKTALEAVEIESTSQGHDDGRLEEATFSDYGRNSIFQSPVRERLQIFLQSSDLYDLEEVLYLIEESELWVEKAILYRKLGQETKVLQILALKLEDSEAAEQYCAEIGYMHLVGSVNILRKLEDSEAAEQYCAEIGRPDAYMQLLDMYLDPQNGKEPMFNAAVRLLHNHGESLDPLQVLETLSADMPLQLASDTILRMLRARLHHHRQGQMVRNLSCAIDVDSRLARLEERSRHVQINEESLCDSCHARLGTKLFAMYPDDSVVCYKCFRRLGESTSVKGRDFKRDILVKPGWLVTR